MQTTVKTESKSTPFPRIALLDVLRGIAMIAMTIFHFSWDLEFFGYAPSGMTSQVGWKLFARGIASSFLIIVGISLMLAHGDGIRWPLFGKRFATLLGAALLISIATYFTTPERFVFFGILHQITIASLIALVFLRLPTVVILSAGIGFLLLPQFFRHELFDQTYFWWSGLAPFDPPSNDYVPVFPWTGWVLVGMALAKYCATTGILQRLAAINPSRVSAGRGLKFLGQNSLIYYLIHQPLMMAALYGLTLIAPPTAIDKAALFGPQCIQSCTLERNAAFCERFCGCVRQELETTSIFQDVLQGKRDATKDPIILDISSMCSGAAQE